MILSKILHLAAAALALAGVAAHPDLSPEEMVEYQSMVARDTETLGRCLESPELQEMNKQMIAHRSETLRRLRKARGISLDNDILPRDKSQLEKWLTVNHRQHDGHSKDPQILWGFKWSEAPHKTAGCILTPESVYGPFWHDHQPRRQQIGMGQQGVYMRLAMQVIDLNTCMPLNTARVDLWHANAKGQYSQKAGEFLRGWQPTSYWGTVDFDTIFPGHYLGRATHLHVAVTPHGENRVVHGGQIYFDEALRKQVESIKPYKDNKWDVTQNIDDGFAPDAATAKYDPLAQWAYLHSKDKFTDGVLAWIAMGVNLSASVPQPPPQARGFRFLNDHLEH